MSIPPSSDHTPLDRLTEDVRAHRGRAWVVEGAPGMGASTFAHAVADRLRARGLVVVGAPALDELRDVPLGALMPLLSWSGGSAPDSTPDALLQRLLHELSGAKKTTVLLIDSAAALDPVSAAAVVQLVRAYGVRCILTARCGQVLPGPIRRLEDQGLLDRIAVPPLDEDAAIALIERAAGGTVSPPSLNDMLGRTGRHPLFLRLLTETSVRSGLARTTALGIDLGEPVVPTRVREIFDEWMGLASPEHRRTLELVAVAGDLPRESLDERAVAELIALGLATGEPDSVRPSSRVVSDVVSDALTPTKRDETRRAAAALLDDRDDERWRFIRILLLSATDAPPSAADMAWASRTATGWGRHADAVRLGSCAMELAEQRGEPIPPDAMVMRGESLWLLGHSADADATYDASLALSKDDATRALAASRAGSYWALRRQQPARAYAITAQALEDIRDPQALAFLLTSAAKWQIMLGEAPPRPAAGGRLGGGERDAAAAALDPNLSVALAACLSGDVAMARQAISGGRPHAEAAVATIRHANNLFDFAGAMVDSIDGRVATARALCQLGTTHRLSEAVGTWTFGLALTEYYSGLQDSSLIHARLAVDQLAWRDLLGFEGFALGLHATVAARLGLRAEAESALGRVRPGMRAMVITDLQVAQAEAWLAVDAGESEPASAIERAVLAAEGRQHDWWLSVSAHAAIRMGAASVVTDVLRRLDPAPTGSAFAPMLAHGEALANSDPNALITAALALESVGMLGAAYDAARQTVSMASGTADAAVARRARVLINRVGASLSPSPVARSGIAELLTEREWAVASVAATRARNREIAERLGVSHRTVEHHLAAVYRKLGVRGRDELRAVLMDPTMT